MTNEINSMSFYEFYENETKCLQKFRSYWLENNLKEPDIFPMEFPSIEDWCEQFNIFK